MLKLKPDEMKEVEHFAREHPLGKVLTEMKHWKFAVGDVLVRFVKEEGGTSVDLVSEVCQVPKKYRVVLVDELGIPWVKQLSVRGGMGNKLYCLASVDAGRYHYQVDPEQLEAILLGYRYDPRCEYRKMREANPEYGSGGETK
jgi:hypothetical protein